MRRRRRGIWKFSESWIGRWWQRRVGVRERFCSQCNQLYLTCPDAKPVEQFVSGSCGALIYPVRHHAKLGFVIRLGKWKPNRNRLELAQLFEPHDLEDLLCAVTNAMEYIETRLNADRAEFRRASYRVVK